jgi:hypothetical protein
MEPPVDRTGWKVGLRVARGDSDELGIIVEMDRGFFKVRWDQGKSSYYRPDVPGDVKLAEPRD